MWAGTTRVRGGGGVRQAHAGCTVLLVLGMLCAVPPPGHAQADSAAVQRIRADLATLEKALTLCESKAAELARLLDFTASRPHRVGAEAIKTFQQNLAALTTCRTPIQDKLAIMQKAIPRPKAEPPQDPPPTQPRLPEILAALQGRMKTLGTRMQALTAQVERLSQGIVLKDSTRQRPRPGW